MTTALVATLTGLMCNGVGVFLLAREVYWAHKTEDFVIFMRSAMRYAKALRADPLAQSERDLKELERKIEQGTASFEERMAAVQQRAARGLPLSDERLDEMKAGGEHMADDLIAELTVRAEHFDERVTPAILEQRRLALIAGVVLLLLGNLLQGFGAYIGSSTGP